MNGLGLCIAREWPKSCCWCGVFIEGLTRLSRRVSRYLYADCVRFHLRHPYIERLLTLL